MKKNLILFLFCPLCIFAQGAPEKIGLGLNYMSLDLPDDMVFRPTFVFEKELKSRFFVATQFGGVYYKGGDPNFNIPEVRRRFTTDVTVKFAVVKYKNNYLKIGGGPSLWYRNDDLVSIVKLRGEAPDFILKPVGVEMQTKKDWSLGYNLTGELEISVVRNVSLAANISIANLGEAGFSSIVGLNCYYRLGSPIFKKR